MKQYQLNYYSKFKCVAGDCKHTCCAGWEMCIDQATLQTYKVHASSFSHKLQKGINFKRAKFKSDRLGRCAFLRDDGLCDIIVNLGEDGLCQVCRDHPRFRSYFNDRVEMGLGFCCEQATKIILSFEDKITPIELFNANAEQTACELDFNQKNILEFRSKVLDLLQDRNSDINERINGVLGLCRANVTERDFNRIVKKFLAFERLDKFWAKRLKSIKEKSAKLSTDQCLSLYCEQFLVNGAYRHLANAEDTLDARARTIACVISWWVVNNIYEVEKVCADTPPFEILVDVVRGFSAEVEYSQKNLDKLFALSYKFIKI